MKICIVSDSHDRAPLLAAAVASAKEAGLENAVRPLIELRLADLDEREAGSLPPAAPAATEPAPSAPAVLPPGTSRILAAMCCYRFTDPRCPGALGDRRATCAVLEGACHTCAANWGSAESPGDPLDEVTDACGRVCR